MNKKEILERSQEFLKCEANTQRFLNEEVPFQYARIAVAANTVLQRYHQLIADLGGCDHSVGICMCEDIQAAQALDDAFEGHFHDEACDCGECVLERQLQAQEPAEGSDF